MKCGNDPLNEAWTQQLKSYHDESKMEGMGQFLPYNKKKVEARNSSILCGDHNPYHLLYFSGSQSWKLLALYSIIALRFRTNRITNPPLNHHPTLFWTVISPLYAVLLIMIFLNFSLHYNSQAGGYPWLSAVILHHH